MKTRYVAEPRFDSCYSPTRWNLYKQYHTWFGWERLRYVAVCENLAEAKAIVEHMSKPPVVIE